jgi:hypothetical protein
VAGWDGLCGVVAFWVGFCGAVAVYVVEESASVECAVEDPIITGMVEMIGIDKVPPCKLELSCDGI